MYPAPFEVRYDERILTGTAELFHWFEYDEPLRVMYFHSHEDHQRWLSGEVFRIINHWTKPAKPPRYWKK